jgi:hypothetical protein
MTNPLKPTKFPVEAGPDPTDDILYGIGQCEKTLADTKAAPEEREMYLSWLIHLIGDEHMPLHCCSLFTSEYPTGDKGGIPSASSQAPGESHYTAFGMDFWARQESRNHT